MQCVVCDEPMREGLTGWHFHCPQCGFEASTLEASDLAQDDLVVAEAERESGLEDLRRRGFAHTFDILSRFKRGGSLLDVGCAHGWFLDAGVERGFRVTGIEPSTRVAAGAASRGHRVRSGYFPSALATDETFDVVSFNDVFEHIPGADDVMEAAHSVLNPDGVLSIALPSSRGIFYRLSKVMARAGMMGPFDRMWQKSFSSPHVYYFHGDALEVMAHRHGFELLYRGSLPSVRLDGLWNRLAYDTTSGTARNAIVYGAVVAAMPFLRVLPADIDLVMFRKLPALHA